MVSAMAGGLLPRSARCCAAQRPECYRSAISICKSVMESLMEIDTEDFRIAAGKTVDLAKWPTEVKRLYKSKEHYREQLAGHIAELSALQEIHFAANRYA